MSIDTNHTWSRRRPPPLPPLPQKLRLLAMVLRGLFMLTLAATIVHVSTPQSERLWFVYQTPGDFVRLTVGAAVALWMLIHAFRAPRDVAGYRAWLYIGSVGLPFALICAAGIW